MKILFFVLIFILLSSFLHATIITVDNKTPSIGNYTNLQEAHDAASIGDTIYVYPSGVAYQAITVTKELTFVGTGFDVDFVGSGNNSTSITGTMTFDPGSEGSKLEGFGQNFYITINADDITIKRNKLIRITITENHTGTTIEQNFFLIISCVYGLILSNNNEALIINNIFFNNFDQSPYTYGGCIEASSSTLTILNNVLRCHSTRHVFLLSNSNNFIVNNIILSGNMSGSGYYYNMCNLDQLPDDGTNIRNVDMSTVFEDYLNYNFNLLAGSPAIGSGMNGVDMGIYGGDTPYIDGGIPGLPSIFQLEADNVVSPETGIDVNIKARSNKE
jgi:hypothetical protein